MLFRPLIICRHLSKFYLFSLLRMGLDSEPTVRLPFLCGSHILFIGPASTDLHKINFKIRSHGTIYTFKNYFVTVFSVFSNKQIDPC